MQFVIALAALAALIYIYGGLRRLACPLIVGDVHARPELLVAALKAARGKRIILLGDLLDGPGGAQGSADCVRIARESGMEMVLGNHELYPLFVRSKEELAKCWGEDPESETALRIWDEWCAIKALLTEEELEWLRNRPLYIKGNGWVAVHAKLPQGKLPPQYVKGVPTPDQVQLVDHTEGSPFWADAYDGAHGTAYYGHTRLKTRKGQIFSPYGVLLDWDAKKGGSGAGCIPGKQPFPLI